MKLLLFLLCFSQQLHYYNLLNFSAFEILEILKYLKFNIITKLTVYIYIYIYIYIYTQHLLINLLQLKYNKIQLLKHLTIQYPTFTLDTSANGEILHIYDYLFHWFSSLECLILKELNPFHTKGFLMFSGDIEKDQWHEMGYLKTNDKNMYTLREKCPNMEFFLVRIFPHSD